MDVLLIGVTAKGRTMKNEIECNPHWCGNSMQSTYYRTGMIHICILYCRDCVQSYNGGYLRDGNYVCGLSVISRNKAEEKAIKAWNKRYYKWDWVLQ